jgi:hypothetical protein
MKTVSQILHVLLVALTVLSTQSIAMARGQSPAVMQAVLCTGHGPTIIHLDKDGNETASDIACAECVVVFAVPVDVANITRNESDFVPFDASRAFHAVLLPFEANRIPPTRAPPFV